MKRPHLCVHDPRQWTHGGPSRVNSRFRQGCRVFPGCCQELVASQVAAPSRIDVSKQFRDGTPCCIDAPTLKGNPIFQIMTVQTSGYSAGSPGRSRHRKVIMLVPTKRFVAVETAFAAALLKPCASNLSGFMLLPFTHGQRKAHNSTRRVIILDRLTRVVAEAVMIAHLGPRRTGAGRSAAADRLRRPLPPHQTAAPTRRRSPIVQTRLTDCGQG